MCKIVVTDKILYLTKTVTICKDICTVNTYKEDKYIIIQNYIFTD